MPDISSLYAQPPSQNNNPLGNINPLQLIPMMQEMQLRNIQIQREQGQLPAVTQQPQAGLNIQRQQLQQQQLEQDLATNNALSSLFGPLGNADAPTAVDVHDRALLASRTFRNVPASTINAFTDQILKDEKGRPRDSAGIKRSLMLLQLQGAGPAASIARVQGPPDPTTGVPTSVPAGPAYLGGAMPTGLPPGAEISSQKMVADQGRLSNYQADVFPWQQALGKIKELQAAGETFGEGSEGRQKFESFFRTLAPNIADKFFDPNKIKKYDEIKKYLTQGVQLRANNMGPHTNEGLATSISGSPNTSVTDLALPELIEAQIAMRRMEQAGLNENQKYGGPNYLKNLSNWSNSQDLRAYRIDMMSPDEIAKLKTTLKGAERAKFNASLRAARDAGVITMPGQ